MRKQVEAARKQYDKASNAIWAYAEHGHMRFSECLARAGDADKAKLDAARAKLDDAEETAIRKGKAYRGPFSMLTWYR